MTLGDIVKTSVKYATGLTLGLALGVYVVIGSFTGEWNPSKSWDALQTIVEQGKEDYIEYLRGSEPLPLKDTIPSHIEYHI